MKKLCGKKMIRPILFLIPFLWGSLFAREEVAIVTIPKAGTHLIKKLMERLGEESTYPVFHTDEFYHSEELKRKYPKRILMVRDPRDVAISWVHYLEGQAEGVDPNIRNLPDKDKKRWRALDFDTKLLFVIRGDSAQTRKAKIHPTLLYYPLSAYEDAISLMEEGETFVCRFENLVGSGGGGSDALQREEIEGILSFLGIALEEERIDQAIEGLFGGTKTFHKGTIGRWKKDFKQSHTHLFDKRREHLLRAFGYDH